MPSLRQIIVKDISNMDTLDKVYEILNERLDGLSREEILDEAGNIIEDLQQHITKSDIAAINEERPNLFDNMSDNEETPNMRSQLSCLMRDRIFQHCNVVKDTTVAEVMHQPML